MRGCETTAECRDKSVGATSSPAMAFYSSRRSAPALVRAGSHRPRPMGTQSGSSGSRDSDRCASQTNRSAPAGLRPPERSGRCVREANPSPFPARGTSDIDRDTDPQCTHFEYKSHVGFSCAEKFEWCISELQEPQCSKDLPPAQHVVRIERLFDGSHTGQMRWGKRPGIL